MASNHIFKIAKPTGYVQGQPQERLVMVRPNIQSEHQRPGKLPGVTLIIQLSDKNQSILLNPSEARDLAVALQYYADELHLEAM